MLNWEKLDTLNEIAKNDNMTADERTEQIQHFMRSWASLVNEDASAMDYTPDWSDPRIPREPVIDPSVEACKARMNVPGLPGHIVCCGYYA